MSSSRLALTSFRSFQRAISTSAVARSGHNKWSKIKEKKGANDAQKSKLLSRAHSDIVIAVRTGGNADPELNPALAAVMKRLKMAAVPKENIENALKKATGGKDKGDQQLIYEVMALGSVGMIIECLSDNVNRTMHSIRSIITHRDIARFAPVKFLFSRQGIVRIAMDKGEDFDVKLERLLEQVLDAGAEDFTETASNETDVEMEFSCQPQDLAKVTSTAIESGLCRELLDSELVYAPLEEASPLEDENAAEIADLVQRLEDHEHVLRVWATHDVD